MFFDVTFLEGTGAGNQLTILRHIISPPIGQPGIYLHTKPPQLLRREGSEQYTESSRGGPPPSDRSPKSVGTYFIAPRQERGPPATAITINYCGCLQTRGQRRPQTPPWLHGSVATSLASLFSRRVCCTNTFKHHVYINTAQGHQEQQQQEQD
jgi:hypothetical protein